MDMDQSQFPADVTPTVNGVQQPASAGIYGTLIPILQQWNQQYDFVGSYYINIGDNPNAADPSTTVWATNLPYYQDLLAMGSEIGTHSYTHLINPPTGTFTAVTSGDTPAGSTTITLTGAPPSFAGVTVGMFVTASNGAHWYEHAAPRRRRRRRLRRQHAGHGGVRQHHHAQLCPRGIQ